MGLSEWMSVHPRVVMSAVGACVLAAVGMAVIEGMQHRHGINTRMPSEFFSTDDGKTFFTAAANNIAPFDYQGQVADRAYVFQCGQNRFVGFLERYNADARKVMVAGGNVSASMLFTGREIKKPGDSQWVTSSDMPAMMKVQAVTCPNQSTDKPVAVEPE